MSSCANNLSPENGSCNHQCATITVAESPSRAGKGKDEEEEYDEDEDVDFNPFLKETSPAASSSLSSEIEVLDSEIVHRGEIVDNVVGTSPLKHPDEVPSNDFGLGEIGEEKMFMQTDAPSFTKAEEELDQTTGRDSKRKLSEFATQTEGDNLREKENTVNYLAKVNGNAETDLSYMPQSQEPTLKSAEEDAICMRTRARYSLASFSLDELEAFLQETDDEDDMHNVNDEEEYRKFLAAVLQGGEEDGHSIEQNENSDDDEDNDADFELELEELLESDDDEATAGKAENGEKINAGRRPQTRRNRKQKASIQHKRIFSEQIKRPLRPLVPILPNETIVPVDRNALMAETTTGSDLIYGFSPLQLDQLHCLIHEHAQLLIQVFSLCVLDPARQHIATQVQGLISDMLCRREELIACRNEPHCLDRGLVSSVLDVRSLNLAKRYMDDVSIAVQDYRQRQLESSCHTSCEREPLFPQPLHISLPKGNSDVQAGGFVAASNPVQSSSSQQQSKKTLAATLVESAKKESVALVPKEISKLAQRFFPLFNSSLFPHRPPPSGVANRVLFTDAEDELLALGIMEYNSDWKAIQQRFLPCKSKHQIFVRQKNRTSSKAPENPIKAVRKMKSSPLTAEEIVRIQEALKYFRFDWMSVWKFIVPYRDPSLLPQQWRIALGVQKSYKQDAAKKEKRRLYDLNRRRSASENGHLASEKEDGHAVNWNKNNGGDCLVDNAGEAYVHEGFLADWRPGFSNFLSSEPQSSNAMGKDQPNNTPSTDGSIRNTQLPTCITGRLQGKQPLDHLSNLTNFSSKNLQQSPYTSNMGSTASRSQIYLRPYRARKSYNTNMVRLAPDLPPVNLPPSVRVISESSFNRVTKVSAVKNGISVAGRDKTIPQTQSLESETAQLVKARDGTTDPLSDKVTGLCQEKSEALKATCITEERGTDPDLEMHPLLFQNPEKEDVVHYSTSRATGASSSFSFFPEDRPQLLSLFNIPRQVNHTADHVKNPANSMELNMASETSGFHPLLQRLDDANDNVIVPCKNLKVSTGLESISCQPKNVSRAVETVAFSSRPSVYSERLKKVNLDIHLSSTSVQEKCSSDLTAKANFSQSTYRSSPENNDDIHAVFPDRDVHESAAPDNRISGFGMDEIGDQSNLGIVMEQEELSDSDEETDENVEFECEEMADSEAEEGSCEEVAEMSDKRNGSRVVERVGADADSSNEQGFGNSQGTMSNSRTRSPSFRRSTVSELGRDSIKSPWLSLDSSRSPLKRNAKHKERRTGKEAMAKTTISCRPSRSSKKAACLTKRVAESKEEVGIAGLLSLGPGDSPLVKKPRKRVCRTNANLNVGTPQEIFRPDDKDTSR